jgi:hypothetical protein
MSILLQKGSFMSKKLNISIQNPCTEDWSKMTPCEKGRFCGKCQKEVVDFTKMTTDQVIDNLMKKSGQDICGLLRNDQLEKPKTKIQRMVLSVYEKASLHINTSGAKFVILMAISSLLTLTGCENKKEEEVKDAKQTQAPAPVKECRDNLIMGVMVPDKTPKQVDIPIEHSNIKGKVKAK